MTDLKQMFGEGANQMHDDMNKIVGASDDLQIAPNPVVYANPHSNAAQNNTPQSGSMLDFSSPLNTIVKSVFFLSLSPMFSGTVNFYVITVACAGAIIYSLTKIKF